MKIFREIIITVLLAVAVFALFRLTVQSYTVLSSSMEPNFYHGDSIMVNKVNYRFSDPQRGQVIIFNPPFDSPHPFVKRVIGLPGDVVEIRDGKVFINSTPLDEDRYIKERPNYTMPATQVSENEYFVLGDNRNHSNDSQDGWTVPRDNIIGKAWFIYWPPGRWGVVKHYSYPELYPELVRTGGQETVLYQSPGGITWMMRF
jgi:signal peptidase I